jgi:hypothetical protein
MSVATRIVVLRATLTVRRGERRRRRQLERELAGFTTPAERLEIEAILDRHTDAETSEVRSILSRQTLRSSVTSRFGAPGTG